MPTHPITASLLGIAALALLSGQGTPATPSPIKIGVVDTEKILTTSTAGKKIMAEIRQQQEKSEASLKQMQTAARELQAKIEAGRNTLSAEQIAELSKEYDQAAVAYRRAQDSATREYNQKRDAALSAFDQKVMPVINLVAREMKYTLIFRKFESGLIYADEAVDVTNSVIQRLDAMEAPAAR